MITQAQAARVLAEREFALVMAETRYAFHNARAGRHITGS
jgi:hypothetical protein